MVAHVCNLSTLKVKVGRSPWEFKTSLTNMVKPHLKKNYTSKNLKQLLSLGQEGRGLYQKKIHKVHCWLNAVAHAFNSSTLGGQDGWIMMSGVREQFGQHNETSSLPKIQKISQGWWAPVIQATWEAEAGKLLSLEPRRQRLQ